MLAIVIEGEEFFDEEASEFTTVGDVTLEFEHSLVSLSKWESKYQVPFLSGGEKTSDQTFDYMRFMLLTPGVSDEVFLSMSKKHIDRIQEYIESPESATTFAELPNRRGPGEIITSELIYYWMVGFTIPFECQYWHLNRLFALIRVCNVKQNGKQTKMSKRELADRNRSINAARKKQLGTSG